MRGYHNLGGRGTSQDEWLLGRHHCWEAQSCVQRMVWPDQAEPERALLPGLPAPPFQPLCHWRPKQEKE